MPQNITEMEQKELQEPENQDTSWEEDMREKTYSLPMWMQMDTNNMEISMDIPMQLTIDLPQDLAVLVLSN